MEYIGELHAAAFWSKAGGDPLPSGNHARRGIYYYASPTLQPNKYVLLLMFLNATEVIYY